jgi:tRNA modification GTPase
MENCTIAAIATPMGNGGIGIVRISGQNAVPIAASIFRKSVPLSKEGDCCHHFRPLDFKPRHLYHGHIIDPEKKRAIDEVLLAIMKAPFSYTREDVVEIHAHAGLVGLTAILELVIKKGAKLAAPGEFTKRAFLNGRIDLTQAEAVIDCINARTERALEMAAAQMKGGLRKEVESIKQAMIGFLTEIEAAMDFPDDVDQAIDNRSFIKNIQKNAIGPLKNLIRKYDTAHVMKDGLRVAVVGRANVGKSSLMNCLVLKERAIVTAIPGTTRDLIEENLKIDGIPIVIGDTAGIQDTDDPLELLGIKKTHEYIKESELILFVVDSSRALTKGDHEIYEKIKKKKVILVFNKKDLVKGPFGPDIPDSWNEMPQIRISALFGEEIETLKKLIKTVCLEGSDADLENRIVPSIRHKVAMEIGLKALSSAKKGILEKIPFELITIDLNEAIDSMNEILGISIKEDIIEKIFDRFCIGK